MLLLDYQIKSPDSELRTLWELGELKDSGLLDASWQEIADFMNKQFRADETEYRTESAYRKIYRNGKMFSEEVFCHKPKNNVPGLTELEEARIELTKERQRLRDERSQYGKYVRDESRFEQRLDEIERLIRENASKKYHFENENVLQLENENEMLILLSDWHIGLEFKNFVGSYNSDIAAERLSMLAGAIYKAQAKHGCNVVHVAVLGDMISGAIRPTIQVANRENVIEQVIKASELLADFLAELCRMFDSVHFVSVAGNHSRIEASKEKAIKDDRLDDLIGWYVKTALSSQPNFVPVMIADNTVSELAICGKLFYFAHGDHDFTTQNGISKLAFMLGNIPYAVCLAHKHFPMMTEVNGVKVIQNGSLCGAGDDHTVEMRLSGQPSQTILICNEDGIECYYPVNLES